MITFPVLDALSTLPSLKSLCVFDSRRFLDRELNGENKEQHMLKSLNGFFCALDNNMNRKITTSTSTTAIKDLALLCTYKLSYTMLNTLRDLSSLRDLCISLVKKPYLGNNGLLPTSDDTCVNLDLCGVLELLRKGKKLKRITFRGMLSSGNQIPSDYLKEKLVEQ